MPEASTAQGQTDPARAATNDKPTPWWRRRFVAPVFFLCLGGALAGGTALAYPTPDAGIAVPAPPVLGLYTYTPVRHLDYSVSQLSAKVTELVVTVNGGFAQAAGAPASNGSLTITLPPGLSFAQCPARCSNPSGGNPATYTVPLAFGIEGDARTFLISAPHFGTNTDSVFAYAAIPEVNYTLAGSAATELKPAVPTFQVAYQIPAAGSYNWSTSPPTVSGSSIMWQQLLSTGDTQGRAAAGVNYAAESSDATLTFTAGILAGFAGGALLAAIQMLLPTGDGSRS